MPTHSRRALALSHLAFEDLGSLEAPLRDRGFDIEMVDVATARFPLRQAESCDLLVVLGDPIGVYDQQDYPFLEDEIACISERLSARKPILGICLGGTAYSRCSRRSCLPWPTWRGDWLVAPATCFREKFS
jgi:GMP synthase (glutamine-hydrolysing)